MILIHLWIKAQSHLTDVWPFWLPDPYTYCAVPGTAAGSVGSGAPGWGCPRSVSAGLRTPVAAGCWTCWSPARAAASSFSVSPPCSPACRWSLLVQFLWILSTASTLSITQYGCSVIPIGFSSFLISSYPLSPLKLYTSDTYPSSCLVLIPQINPPCSPAVQTSSSACVRSSAFPRTSDSVVALDSTLHPPIDTSHMI